MIKTLASRVEFWIVVAGLALLGVGVALFYDPTPPPIHVLERTPSTNHRSGYGLKAIYMVLGRVGFDVTRAETADAMFENTDRLVVVVRPAARFGWDKNAARRLGDWVWRGGHAVFVPGSSADSDFGDIGRSSAALEIVRSNVSSGGDEFVVRGPERRVVSRVVAKTDALIKARGTGATLGEGILVGDTNGALVMEVAHGSGRIVFASDPYLLSNAGLKNAGNATYVAALFGRLAKSRGVVFDEFHHGFGGERSDRGIWDVITAGPGGSIVALICLVFLAWAVSVGRRFGAAVRIIRTERRSSVEYVEAFASLLRRAGRDGLALWFIADAFRHEAARRLGCGRPPDNDAELARRFAARWRVETREVEAALAAGRGAPQRALSEADVLRVAEQIEMSWKKMVDAGRGRNR